jgi:hypothetical protein
MTVLLSLRAIFVFSKDEPRVRTWFGFRTANTTQELGSGSELRTQHKLRNEILLTPLTHYAFVSTQIPGTVVTTKTVSSISAGSDMLQCDRIHDFAH